MAYELVVVGASWGGLHAVQVLLAGLPVEFALPVVVVQHREAGGGDELRLALQAASVLPVHEPEDKDDIVAGYVYLAPADYHLLVEQGLFGLSTEGPVAYARPSIDVLFKAAADAYGNRAIGVILTGASRDGAEGVAAIKQRGGLVVVQHPATAEKRAMPEAATAAARVDHVLLLEEIGPFLSKLCTLAG